PPEALLVGEDSAEGLDPAQRIQTLGLERSNAGRQRVQGVEHALHVQALILERGHRTGGEVETRRLGAQPLGEGRARTVAVEGKAAQQKTILRCSARSATWAATRPLRRPSSNSKVGCALSSGKSWGFRTSSGPMLGTASRASRSTLARCCEIICSS